MMWNAMNEFGKFWTNKSKVGLYSTLNQIMMWSVNIKPVIEIGSLRVLHVSV